MAINEVFEEWNTYAKKRVLFERNFEYGRVINNSSAKIVAITGIRRSGKSSILMLLLQSLERRGERGCYVNLEDNRLSGKDTLDELLKWFGEDGYMLLDEITSVAGWEGWLLRVHEQLKGRLRIIASSSRKGLTTQSKPLRGRMLPVSVYPLSFSEYLSFRKVKVERTTAGTGRLENALMEYIKYGGFPEVVLAPDKVDKISYLNTYFNDIIGLDIAEAAHENVDIVQKFAQYSLASKYFSASKALAFFKSLGYKIGKSKILKLESYAGISSLFSFVPIYSYNIKDRLQYPRKSYAGDTGFYHAITGKDDIGMPFENMVFLELQRRVGIGESIYYWKDSAGHEVDFVIAKGDSVTDVVQACYDASDAATRKRELLGAVSAAKAFGLKKALIVNSNIDETVKEDGVNIRFTPAINWVLGWNKV